MYRTMDLWPLRYKVYPTQNRPIEDRTRCSIFQLDNKRPGSVCLIIRYLPYAELLINHFLLHSGAGEAQVFICTHQGSCNLTKRKRVILLQTV